jgi:hypothetical protein
MTLRPERNEISGHIAAYQAGTRFFAIAATRGPFRVREGDLVRALTGATEDMTGMDLNGDGVVNAADLILCLQLPNPE